jgi:hypothetical protein
MKKVEIYNKYMISIQLLLTSTLNLIDEFEKELKKEGDYKVGIKHEVKKLKRLNLMLNKELFRVLDNEQKDAFIEDLDSLEPLLNNELEQITKRFTNLK